MNTSALCINLHRVCIIALTAMVANPTAQAADTTLTLTCQGTAISDLENAKPEPVSMGIIVNFTNRTVHGFGYPDLQEFPVKITAVNEVTVAFGGSDATTELSVNGFIDRVTGDLAATLTSLNRKDSKSSWTMTYALKCRPTQRMF